MSALSGGLLLCAAVVAAAPADVAARVGQRARERGLGAAPSARLVAAVEQARGAGLPVEPVEDKILEGLAKGVAPERILEAVGDLRRRLEIARQVLAEAEAKVQPGERRAVLERLAATVQGDGQDLLALARRSQGAGAQPLTAAARQLAELRRRGVEAASSVPALAALARAEQPAQIARVSALLDEYFEEGGSDSAAFLAEVRARAEQCVALDGIVDPFGTSADPLHHVAPGLLKKEARVNPAKAEDAGQPSLEKSDRAGSVPGLDKESVGRKSKCVGKKQPAWCD